MRRRLTILLPALALAMAAAAQNVTVKATNMPAATVFRSIMEQTGMNFVYPSPLLKDMRVTVDARDRKLKKVLRDIFKDSDIAFEIKGKNVILKKKKKVPKKAAPVRIAPPAAAALVDTTEKITMLSTLEVVSEQDVASPDNRGTGVSRIDSDDIRNMPALLGEADVVKALRMLPGVEASSEGLGGMTVHGGDADQNMYLLSGIPLYHVEHIGGLFSPFNADVVKYVDLYKTSMPARFDGRLSSFMDVALKNGNHRGHHGSAHLGLTAGSFSISGPIGEKTSYIVGVRRSWLDVITTPFVAIASSVDSSEKFSVNYHFTDLNAGMRHSFSDRVAGFVNLYFGDDLLSSSSGDKKEPEDGFYYKDKYRFNWGNILAQAGADWEIGPSISSRFTASFSRYFSGMLYDTMEKEISPSYTDTFRKITHSSNHVNDFAFRSDFIWNPADSHRARFGASYTFHSFLPERSRREITYNGTKTVNRDISKTVGANEVNAYIEDSWTVSDRLQADAGLHASIFHIDSECKWGVSPRFSLGYRPAEGWRLNAAYSRTVQYVHRIDDTYLSLPSDKWMPVRGQFQPLTADKIGIGGVWQSPGGDYAVTLEGYMKWMHNLLAYRDEYYLDQSIAGRLTAGKGTAKGIDLMLEKRSGNLTGHISYSLAWADRTFREKNGGMTYPARFDHRHTVKVFLNWDISRKVSLSALWTGHSGDRFTLMPQRYDNPDFPTSSIGGNESAPLKAPVNNYQLPFYHRLDLTCTVRNSRGYWQFGLYNAYCNMNTVAVVAGYTKAIISWTTEGGMQVVKPSMPVFQKFKLIPIIPSISYTWQF